ncbi:putative alpha/beta hydrolase [Candidatus Termititenax persephonae]|uniref:Alpha/beta hydrolase n=1 Tax=Candidatus Termititenax persephonae TaxID=2218525 RepID=A0A388TFP6_9BACT|nr:putative alpha/beta hydrolase [Candidatus Termititenax persephonae]
MRKLFFIFLLSSLFAAEYSLYLPQRVEIPCPRGLTMVGTYYAVNSTQNYAVILIHGLGRNRGDWNDLARYLQKEGIAALSIDLRGHGESLASDKRSWRSFGDADYAAFVNDLSAVLQYAGRNLKFTPRKTGLLGQGLGANLACQLAERNPNMPGVILLSPGLDYKGVKLTVKNYRKPIYALCSRFEENSLEALEYLRTNYTGKYKSDIYDHKGTLISLFRQKFTLPENAAKWFKQIFADT